MAKEDRGEEYQLETARFAGGLDGNVFYNRYPVLYQTAVSEVLRAVNGEDFMTLVRTASTGTAQGTHGMWASDANENFTGLRSQLRFGPSESLTGHFAWGSDVGGIDPVAPANATQQPDAVAVHPLVAVRRDQPGHERRRRRYERHAVALPEATVNRFRDASTLHMELFPYFYGLAQQAAPTGVPILRALGYEFPDDPQAWAQDQELMIGPNLLAAPVTADRAEADGAAGRADAGQRLPARGPWIDLYSGERVEGGRTFTREATLDEFPLYMKAGSAIGFNSRAAGRRGAPTT